MKIALITPWENAWIPLYRAAFERRGHEFIVCTRAAPSDSDVVLHGWAAGTPPVKGARNIVFLRRYELFDGGLERIDWAHIDDMICVNSWIMDAAQTILKEKGVSVPVHLIFNAVDESDWTYAVRKPGKKIGMACFIHVKKNLPLAIQILAALPQGYELHIAGGVQSGEVALYMNHIAASLGKTLHIYEQVPSEAMDKWWDQMNYCLSTSYTEGNPNNVNEAMAKGIKPVVHNWVGALDQYAPWTFNSVQEAVSMIVSDDYDSPAYLARVRERFSLANIEKVVDMALEPVARAQAVAA